MYQALSEKVVMSFISAVLLPVPPAEVLLPVLPAEVDCPLVSVSHKESVTEPSLGPTRPPTFKEPLTLPVV